MGIMELYLLSKFCLLSMLMYSKEPEYLDALHEAFIQFLLFFCRLAHSVVKLAQGRRSQCLVTVHDLHCLKSYRDMVTGVLDYTFIIFLQDHLSWITSRMT